jgi:tryptophan synthase alpha subunit
MNRLQAALDSLTKRKGGSPVVMTHVVLGYPTLKESMAIVREMADSGVFCIELQIPFSDPMADGPTIMRANEAALREGTTPRGCMKAMEQLAREVEIPLLFMSYFNLLFNYQQGGVSRFMKDAAQAGASGLIVPDVPPEENEDGYWTLSKQAGLIPIPLISPVSSEARMKKVARSASKGFVYCVATTGTTGARKTLPQDLKQYLNTVRRHFSLPRAVGFGISSAEHVKALSGCAEIAIVGSAMIDKIDQAKKSERLLAVRKFTRSLANA